MDELCSLPLEKLVEPWVLLRPVKTHTVEFLEMKDSIASKGFLNSISVRPCPRREGFYEIIDGMYRSTCARELGLTSIFAIIKYGISDEDVLSLQIQANAIRPETKPCEFACQLKRIQKANTEICIADLSRMISKSPAWVGQQLGLLNLTLEHQKMVDRGEICLNNAYMLAKIPPAIRMDYLDKSKTMKTTKFRALVSTVLKQFKEAVRQGKLDVFYTEDFEPQPYLHSLKEMQSELQTNLNGPLIITSMSCKTALEGWNAALKWALHLDRKSVEEQEEKSRAKVRKNFES